MATEVLPHTRTFKPLNMTGVINWIIGQIVAYLFLLPVLVIFAMVVWYPIVRTFDMSLHDVSLRGESTWAGLDNFDKMEKDPALEIIWKNTLQFGLWSILLGYFIPVIVAILIREVRNFNGFFRVVYFLPTVVPISIAIIIWRFIYDPDSGVLNNFLSVFGLDRQLWLRDSQLVKPSMVTMMTWGSFGTTALIYLSSLQEIPIELYDAAELDGASPLMRIRYITLPYLAPMMSLLLIIQILAVAQVFTEPLLLTNGGPGRETLTPVLHIYNRAFLRADVSYGAAWSVVLVIVLMAFSALYQFVDRRFNANN